MLGGLLFPRQSNGFQHVLLFALRFLERPQTRAAKKHNRILNVLASQAALGLEILGEHANDARIRTVEKFEILVGLDRLVGHGVAFSS